MKMVPINMQGWGMRMFKISNRTESINGQLEIFMTLCFSDDVVEWFAKQGYDASAPKEQHFTADIAKNMEIFVMEIPEHLAVMFKLTYR